MEIKQIKDCKTTILEMINLIPADKENLIKDLRDDHDLYLLNGTEEQMQWRRTIRTLYKHIQRPIDDWEYEVVSLFTNKPVEEIRRNQERIHKNTEIK